MAARGDGQVPGQPFRLPRQGRQRQGEGKAEGKQQQGMLPRQGHGHGEEGGEARKGRQPGQARQGEEQAPAPGAETRRATRKLRRRAPWLERQPRRATRQRLPGQRQDARQRQIQPEAERGQPVWPIPAQPISRPGSCRRQSARAAASSDSSPAAASSPPSGRLSAAASATRPTRHSIGSAMAGSRPRHSAENTAAPRMEAAMPQPCHGTSPDSGP